MIFDLCDNPQSERDAVAWGYDSVVPAYGLPRKHIGMRVEGSNIFMSPM
jgi:hypothetical protein